MNHVEKPDISRFDHGRHASPSPRRGQPRRNEQTPPHGPHPLADEIPDEEPREHLDPPSLVIDCDSCLARGPSCAECMVTAIMGCEPTESQPGLRLRGDEINAMRALSEGGLLPPLRLVRPAV